MSKIEIHDLARQIREAAQALSSAKLFRTRFVKETSDFEISVTNSSDYRNIIIGDTQSSRYGYALLYSESKNEDGTFSSYKTFPSAAEIEKRLLCILEGRDLEKEFPCAGYGSYISNTNRNHILAPVIQGLSKRLSEYVGIPTASLGVDVTELTNPEKQQKAVNKLVDYLVKSGKSVDDIDELFSQIKMTAINHAEKLEHENMTEKTADVTR